MNIIKEAIAKYNNDEFRYTLQDNMLYRSKNTTDEQLIQEDVILFDVAVDNKGMHHILTVLKNGLFNYQKEESDGWKVKKLEKYPNNVNKIEHMNIECINDSVHILYDFRIYGKNAKNYNYKSFIMHLYNKGVAWRKSNISNFTQSKPPRYHYSLLDSGDLIYYKIHKNQKNTLLTPYRFSTKTMSWTKKQEIKLSTDIGSLELVYNDESQLHFFFYNHSVNKLNYFNSNVNLSEEPNTSTIYNNEELEIQSAMKKNNRLVLLGSYKGKTDKVLLLEKSREKMPWDSTIYDLNISSLMYIDNPLKLNTYKGIDSRQSIVLLIDEYAEEPIEVPEINETIEDIEIDENNELKEVFNEEIIENHHLDEIGTPISKVNLDIDKEVDICENSDVENISEPPANTDLSYFENLKLRFDNIFKKIAEYLTQND